MERTQEPLPCPFCSGTDLNPNIWGSGGRYTICLTCGAYGPDEHSGHHWNDRPKATQPNTQAGTGASSTACDDQWLTDQDLKDYREQAENHGPTCPECGEGAMNPKNPADPDCDEFYCGECLFNDGNDDGSEV